MLAAKIKSPLLVTQRAAAEMLAFIIQMFKRASYEKRFGIGQKNMSDTFFVMPDTFVAAPALRSVKRCAQPFALLIRLRAFV